MKLAIWTGLFISSCLGLTAVTHGQDVSGIANAGAIYLGDDPLYHDSVGIDSESFVPVAASSMVSELAGNLSAGLGSHGGLKELNQLIGTDEGSVHAASGELNYPIHLYRLPGPVTDQATDLVITYRSYGSSGFALDAQSDAVTSSPQPFGPGWHESWTELLDLKAKVPLASGDTAMSPSIISSNGMTMEYQASEQLSGSLLGGNRAAGANTEVFVGPKDSRLLREMRPGSSRRPIWCREFLNGTRIEYGPTPEKGLFRPVRVFRGDYDKPEWAIRYRYLDQETDEVATQAATSISTALPAAYLALSSITDHRGIVVSFNWGFVGGSTLRVLSISVARPGWAYNWKGLTTYFQYESASPFRLERILGAERDFVEDLDRSGDYEASESFKLQRPTMRFSYHPGGNLLNQVIDESGGASRLWQTYTWDTSIPWRVSSQLTGDPSLPNPPAGHEARLHTFKYPSSQELVWVDPRGVTRTYTHNDYGQTDPAVWQVVTIKRDIGPLDPRPAGTNYASKTWHLSWDGNLSGLLTSATLPSGVVFDFQWEFGRRLPSAMTIYPNTAGPVISRSWNWSSWSHPDPRLRNRLISFVDAEGVSGLVNFVTDINGVTSEVSEAGVLLFRVREDNEGRALWQDEMAFDVDGGGTATARREWTLGSDATKPDYRLIKARQVGGSASPTEEFEFEGPGFHVSTVDAMGLRYRYKRNIADRIVELTPPSTLSGPNGRYTVKLQAEYDLRGDPAMVLVPAYEEAGANKSFAHSFVERKMVNDIFGRAWKVYQDITPLDDAGPTQWEVRTFQFDATNRLVSYLTSRGREAQFVFDDHDRLYQTLTRMDASQWSVESIDYNEDGQAIRYEDGTGFYRQWGYDSYGRFDSLQDPSGIEVQYSFDLESRTLTEEIWGNGVLQRTHHFDRDVFGRVWNERITSPTSTTVQSTQYLFTGIDRVEREIYEDGASTSYFYDAMGRRSRWTNDLSGPGTGTQVERVFDANNNLVEVRNTARIEKGGVVSNPLDRMVFIRDAWGRKIQTDRYGDKATVQMSTSYGYTSLSDVAFHRNNVGQITRARNDAVGRTLRVTTTPVGGGPDAVLSAIFDDSPSDSNLSQIETITDAEGRVSEYRYNLRGDRVQERHPGYSLAPRNLVWDYEFDTAGRLTGWVDGNGTVVEVEHDSAGRERRLWSSAPASGVSTLMTEMDLSYDDLNRISESRTWYGAFGNSAGPSPQANLLVSVGQGYDEFERPLHESFGFLDNGAHQPLVTKVVTSGWNLPGGGEDIEFRRSLTLDSGLQVSYSPDNVNRVASMGVTGAGLSLPDFAEFRYAGFLLSETSLRTGSAADRLTTTRNYDSFGMLEGITSRFGLGQVGDPVLYDLGIVRDMEGDILQLHYDKVDGSGGDWIQRDGFGRAKTVKLGVPSASFGGTFAAASAARTDGFTYDRNHNRKLVTTQFGGGLAQIKNYSLVAGTNQYEKAAGAQIVSDGNGNIIEDGNFLYSYDFLNRLSEVRKKVVGGGSTLVAYYGYDPDNRRIVRLVDGALTFAAWDRTELVEEYDGGFNPTRSFLKATDHTYDQHLAYVLHSGPKAGVYSMIQDHQNSVTRVVDAQGAVVERYEYDAYGKRNIFDASGVPQSSSQVGNPYGYTGRFHDDESGLVYFRNRHYSPKLGRFITTDRIGLWGDALNVGNGYAFTGSRPMTMSDPTGDIGTVCIIIPDRPKKKKKRGGNDDGPNTGRGSNGRGSAGRGSAGRGSNGRGSNGRSGGGCRGGDGGDSDGGGDSDSGGDTDGGGDSDGGSDGGGESGAAGGAAGGGASGGSGSGAGAGGSSGSGGVVKEIVIDGDKYPESAKHLEDSGNVGKPLTVDREGKRKRRREALKGVEPVPGKHRDECPPAVFKEGGKGASVRPIDPGDNSGSGASIGNQLKGVKDGEKVVIRIKRSGD